MAICETADILKEVPESKRSEHSLKRQAWRNLLGALCLLPIFLFLQDVPAVDADAMFDRAQKAFVHGYLEDSQREAERGYLTFIRLDPPMARKFQLLEATTLVWRSLDEAALKVLADDRIPWPPQDRTQRLTLIVTALTKLHRFPEAAQALVEAKESCAAINPDECGAVYRADALLLLEQGYMGRAQEALLKCLEFARVRKDGLLEATALLNLGSLASRKERHDEALNYYRLSSLEAKSLGANDLEQNALGNEGWEQYTLGNTEKALQMFDEAGSRAAALGDIGDAILWLTTAGTAHADTGQLDLAEKSDLRALDLASKIGKEQSVIDASEELAQVYIYEQRPQAADQYSMAAESLAKISGSQVDILYCHMLQGEAAALRHDWPRADSLLHEVAAAPESQTRMRWTAEHTLATMYEAQGQPAAAEQSYKAALALVEGARADLKQELSQLTFLTNAARIYDDYIHFLVAQGRGDEALEAADWSRARTLQQGLGLISADASLRPPPLRAREIARRTNSTLLFYWMGERQSYVWAVAPEKMTLVTLPAKSEIVTRIERYRRTLLALRDPLRENGGQGDKDGRELYEMLVAPVAGSVATDHPAILFTDGEMSQLNFETLLVGAPTPHYWIEDATVSSAPSIRLVAAKARASASRDQGKLLLLGNAISPDPALPHLPMADLEVHKVQAKFKVSDEAVFSGARATPLTYLASKPEQFSYIHFVAHGTASTTDPLESAVILSPEDAQDKAGEDSYKLYARDILRHPISARLVTISACNSSGTKSYAGEGMVGLSWAFLRAGAHNTIGALWDVSDASTPELMDHLYSGLQRGEAPAAALREAKLSLLHSGGNFSRPFYWAPFQLYSGH